MQWPDTGFVLGTRRHGESALIVELLTQRARAARRAGARRAVAAPARAAAARQRGRRELARPAGRASRHARLRTDRAARRAFSRRSRPARRAQCGGRRCCSRRLPEREPHPDCHRLVRGAAAGPRITTASTADWARGLCRAGNATCSPRSGSVSISARCAVTGTNQDLAYVSPRTGRAVSRETGAPYQDRLLPLPGFLWRPDAPAESRRHRRRPDPDPAFPAAPSVRAAGRCGCRKRASGCSSACGGSLLRDVHVMIRR